MAGFDDWNYNPEEEGWRYAPEAPTLVSFHRDFMKDDRMSPEEQARRIKEYNERVYREWAMATGRAGQGNPAIVLDRNYNDIANKTIGMSRSTRSMPGSIATNRAATARANARGQLAGQQEFYKRLQERRDRDAWKQYLEERAQERREASQTNDETAMKAEGVWLKALGTMAAFSDKTTKKNIKPISDKENEAFLDSLAGYSWKYKKEAFGDTKRTHRGLIAQDLEKTKIGKNLVGSREVFEYPEGTGKVKSLGEKKFIKTNSLTVALAQSVGYLNKKVNKLAKALAEQSKKGKKGKE